MPEKKSKLVEIKTKPTAASVGDFLNGFEAQQREDSFALLEMLRKATGEEPKLWGNSIIGFGDVHYKSPKTGREVEWFRIGFSPRKANLTIYLMNLAHHAEALQKLGKHKTGVGCLYINKLSDVDRSVLEGMIAAALDMNSDHIVE